MLHKHSPSDPSSPPRLRAPWLSLIVAFASLSSCARSENRPPSFLQLEDQTWATNQAEQLEILATDPDQDFVSFSFTLSPPPSTQTEGSNGQPTLSKLGPYQAVFSWTPGNADEGTYSLNLVVEDQQGARAEESISLTVVNRGLAGGEVVRFIEPTGEVLIFDTSEGDCLEADVTLEAVSLSADELSLTLDPEAPAGMMIATEGNKRYTLTWCPSQEQLSAQSQYPVSLIASNTRGLPNVVKRLLILIRTQGVEGCSGEPPTLSYSPLSDQRGLENVRVEVTVTDDQGIKSPPTLSYQYVEGAAEGGAWTTVVMQSDAERGEGAWFGLIPPTALGRDVRVQYYISVRDDDDPMGALCDHLTEGSTYEFEWRWDPSMSPSYGLCEACQLDLQCGGAGDLCVLPLGPDQGLTGNLEGVCGLACDEQLRCPDSYECVEVMSLEGVSGRQCLRSRGCGVATCVADSYDQREMNQTEQSATLLTAGEYPNLTICGDDVDWYEVSVQPSQDVRVSLEFAHYLGDIDMELRLEGVTPARSYFESSSTDNEVHELRTPCIEELSGPLSLFIKVSGFSGAQNSYGMTISQGELGGGCVSACEELSDCAVGSYCRGGECVAASCGGASSCSEGLTCLAPRAGLMAQGDQGMCALECQSDLVCRTGERCKRFDDFRSYCVPSGTQRAGERCESFSECGEGTICFPNGGAGFCAVANCSAGSCQSGTICADVGIGGDACLVSCLDQVECDGFGLTCRHFNGVQGCAP